MSFSYHVFSTLDWLLDVRRNIIVPGTKILVRLEINPVLLQTMELPDSLRLGNEQIKVCENGSNTKKFCCEVTKAGLPSEHEWVKLDPGLWDQGGQLIAAYIRSQ